MRETIRRLAASSLAQNSAWLMAVSVSERFMALVQTVLIARALGVTEYGRYGLLFQTHGFISQLLGLQMGITGTVLIARYKETNPGMAAGVRTNIVRFGWVVAFAVCALTLPFASPLSAQLFDAPGYQATIIISAVLFGGSLLSGIQYGIAQGFEDFRGLTVARIAGAFLPVPFMYSAARAFGLAGVTSAALGGVLASYLIILVYNRKSARRFSIPEKGSGASFWSMLLAYALPTTAVSSLVGFASWYGIYVLRHEPNGFDSIAHVNVGMQWRGPILMIASTMATVLLPRFSQQSSKGDIGGLSRLRRKMLVVNLAGSVVIFAGLTIVSPLILAIYGTGFGQGEFVFALIIAGTIPYVLSNILAQELLGSGRTWLQFFANIPAALVQTVPLYYLVHEFGGLGYAFALLAGALVLLATLALAVTFVQPKSLPGQPA